MITTKELIPELWPQVESLFGKNGASGGCWCQAWRIDGETPIGWCNFGPRDDFPRLNRARTLQCSDSSRVWSIPCFFVLRG